MANIAHAPRYERLARISRLAHEIGASGRLNGHSQQKIDCAGAFFGRALHDASLAENRRADGGIHPLLELGNGFFTEATKGRRNPNTEAHLSGMMQKARSTYDVLIEVSPSAAAYNNRGLAKEFLEDYDGAISDLKAARQLAGGEEEKKSVDAGLCQVLSAKERHNS